MADEPKYYYKKLPEKSGKQTYIPYPFKEGEKAEYEAICELADGWGGKPCDIDWARSTKVFQEAKLKLKPLKP